ncbi:MAG: hypothetical protein JWM33_407 [Caulobacteraceae bacterium]|nr:hypothetical protein [Caulobacteraceae bacterium]
MTGALILHALALAAAAAGANLAATAQPACHWSSLGAIALKTRLAMIRAVTPSRHRARLAALGLAGLLCAGALAAYAAEPSAPERLAAQAAGVVGSGDQLALQLKDNNQERTIRPGDVYADGWKLDALTPTSATLVKDGERREVGLNPTGALASKAPAAPPSQVTLAGEDARLLAAAIARNFWDGQKLQPGLTLQETQRYWTLYERFSETYKAFQIDLAARAAKAGVKLPFAFLPDDILSALGPQYAPEFAALTNKMADERDGGSAAAFARYGPVTVHVASPAQAAAATAPYGQAAWTQGSQAADGSFDMTMTAPVAGAGGLGQRYSMDLAANPPPLDSIQVMVATTDVNGHETWNLGPQPRP